MPQGQDGNGDDDMLRTLSAAESSKAPLGGQQGLGGRSGDVEHVELHDVPAHKHQVSPNAQDHVGMKDTMVMPAEERDCSQTRGAGSILSQYGNSASMQSTPASPPHYAPPTPRY